MRPTGSFPSNRNIRSGNSKGIWRLNHAEIYLYLHRRVETTKRDFEFSITLSKMRVAWSRLIRFVTTDGRVLRGEPIMPTQDFDLGKTTEDTKLQARVIVGDDIYDTSGKTKVSDEIVTVKRLLGPLTAQDVDILRCVGLNYIKHSRQCPRVTLREINIVFILTNDIEVREAGRTPPPFPFIFFKPTTCLHDHGTDIEIPRIAQNDQADYEGELSIVIGKDAKDVPLEAALDYVAAYTAGNDISSRRLQREPQLAGTVPQWGFSKGFDTFAPHGPALVAAPLIEDPKELLLQTIIDGEVRQKEFVSDLLFDCAYLIHYLSQGTTIRKGSLIMTGTPGGVGAGLKPPKYLVPGTVMEVSISKIGTLRNGVSFV